MHRNDTKYNQLFRDRFRDHSLPVRQGLWSRIHSGIKGIRPISQAPHPGFLRAAVQYGRVHAMAVTAAAAVTAGVVVGVIYFSHPAKPLRPAVAIAPGKGAGAPFKEGAQRDEGPQGEEGSQGGARGASGQGGGFQGGVAPDSAARVGASQGGANEGVAAQGGGNEAGGAAGRQEATGEGSVAGDRVSNAAAGVSEKVPGALRAGETAATPGGSGAGQHAMHRLHSSSIMLPALASTGTRGVINARPLVPRSLRSRLNDYVKGSGSRADTGRFRRTGYVSLYSSVDFPNHYYTWSNSSGVRLTFEFSRHWSFTAGLEYATVNVQTQVVPPINYLDTLHAFHIKNYEVPLLVGYRKKSGRSELAINAGAILNLYSRYSTSNWVFNWPNRDSYGAVLGVDYSYLLGRHLALFGQPYVRYSISDNRSFIQSQRYSLGTLLGLRYQL